MGTEPRLGIVRVLLSAHPDEMIVGNIGSELNIPSSTLSHYLEKLKKENFVRVKRQGVFLVVFGGLSLLKNSSGFCMPSAAPETTLPPMPPWSRPPAL